MACNISSTIVCHLNQGPDSPLGELEVQQMVRWTDDSTTCHDRNEISPTPQLIPTATKALWHTIADSSKARHKTSDAFLVITSTPKITMASSLAQCVPRDEQSWACNQPLLTSLFECERSTTTAPRDREASSEHVAADERHANQSLLLWHCNNMAEIALPGVENNA
jgi:hypothetical protein